VVIAAWLDPLQRQSEPSMPGSETDRVEHTRLRRRMLYGLWREDLRARIRLELRSEERADAWGEPDLTGNIYRPTCQSLATLYAPIAPRPAASEPGGDVVLEMVQRAGLWDLMVRVQRDTIGLREMLVRVEAVAAPGSALGWELSYRPVYPDRVVAEPREGCSDLPGCIYEAVQLEDYDGEWGWDVWELGDDGEPPSHRVLRADRSTVVLEESGDAYPYRDELGQPVLPYSLYHAERTGYLWDPWEWLEIVEGALRLGVLWTFFGHLIKNASWPQRYMVGAFLPATTAEESDDAGRTSAPPRVRVAADPALVLVLATDPDSTAQPQIGSFAPGSDPLAVANAIKVYEGRVTALADVDPANLQKVSGDPRSGYAISVSQNSAERARMRFRPQFLRGDLETLRVSAAVLGSRLGVSLPGTGYTIEYGPLPAVEGGANGRGGSTGNGATRTSDSGDRGAQGGGDAAGDGAGAADAGAGAGERGSGDP
jgi:hypothetical protein